MGARRTRELASSMQIDKVYSSGSVFKILQELYAWFTTTISPLYKDVTINDSIEVRLGDTTSPKLFGPFPETLCGAGMERLGVKIDGRQPQNLRIAVDIVLMAAITSQAERMLADFDRASGMIELQLNDVHEKRISFCCPIHAPQNEHFLEGAGRTHGQRRPMRNRDATHVRNGGWKALSHTGDVDIEISPNEDLSCPVLPTQSAFAQSNQAFEGIAP